MDEILIHFRLVGDEARALHILAAAEERRPREQIRYLLRQELVRRGLLRNEGQAQEHAVGRGGEGDGQQ